MRQRSSGFSLVELIVVLVVMGILTVGTTRYISQTSEAFVLSARISALTSGGRIAIERINREVRAAVPNSVRVSTATNCLEFLPNVGATRYMVAAETDTVGGGIAKPAPVFTPPVVPPGGAFSVLDFDESVNHLLASYVLINPVDTSEVYGAATPGPLAGFDRLEPNGDPTLGVLQDIYMTAPYLNHVFNTGLGHSPSFRVYLATQPVSYCVGTNGHLRRYAGYGLLTTQFNPATDVAGSEMVVADGIQNNTVTAPPVFSYDQPAQERKAIVNVLFKLSFKDQQMTLNHEIQIRNTP